MASFADSIRQAKEAGQNKTAELVARIPPPQVPAGASQEELQAIAWQYRQQLRQHTGPGEADRAVKLGIPGLVNFNPHKPGGFSKIGGAVGDVAGKVAPFTAFIPGVGPGIAAGLTAASRTLGKLNDPGGLEGTKVFKEIGLPTALTYGAGKASEALFGGAGAAEGAIDPKLAPLGDSIRTGTGHTLSIGGGGTSNGFLGTLGRIGGGIVDFLGSDAGRTIAETGLGALDLYGRHQDRSNQSAFLGELLNTQRAALGEAEKQFAAKQPLRDASTNTLTATLNSPQDIFRSRGRPAGFVGGPGGVNTPAPPTPVRTPVPTASSAASTKGVGGALSSIVNNLRRT